METRAGRSHVIVEAHTSIFSKLMEAAHYTNESVCRASQSMTTLKVYQRDQFLEGWRSQVLHLEEINLQKREPRQPEEGYSSPNRWVKDRIIILP